MRGILACVVAIILLFAIHWDERTSGPDSTLLAIVYLFGTVIYFFVGKLYAVLWGKYGKPGIVKWIYETVLLPIMTIQLARGAETGLATSNPGLYVLAMLSIFIALSDFSGSARDFLLKHYPEPHAREQRMLFSRFPPVSPSDLVPLHFYYWVFSLVIVIRHVMNW